MASPILYNKEAIQDVVQVLSFIDAYTKRLGVEGAVIDSSLITSVVSSCNSDSFPYNEGSDKASGFKKVANFVCHFIAVRPILEPFPGFPFSVYENHQNAVIAFELARVALHKSKIERSDKIVVIDNPIQVSKHSYLDIIDALSNVSPVAHWKIVTVLFEQLVYKTNPHCQYSA